MRFVLKKFFLRLIASELLNTPRCQTGLTQHMEHKSSSVTYPKIFSIMI
jgi:hypothetical protein